MYYTKNVRICRTFTDEHGTSVDHGEDAHRVNGNREEVDAQTA